MPTARPTLPFLRELLRLALRREASAVIVVPWMPPTLRIDEQSVPLSTTAFTPEQAATLVRDLLDDERRLQLDRSRELQFDLDVAGIGHLRVHAFRRHGQPAMAIRPFSTHVPAASDLALPALACQAAMGGHGLLVLASRSVSMRRATATALLQHRNHHGRGEIALLDDATRHWHGSDRCQVRNALTPADVDDRLAGRRPRGPARAEAEPLAVSWGELHDGARLAQAVRIAERALCLVTLDAPSAESALLRLVSLADEFGADQRRRLALALQVLLVLQPVPAAAGGRELAATEVLGNSPELAATLLEGDRAALLALVGHPAPMATTGLPLLNRSAPDEHLRQLVAQGLVEVEVAARHAGNRERFVARHALDPGAAPTSTLAPVRVDTAFADLFDEAPLPRDPFDLRPGSAEVPGADTQFDGVAWTDAHRPAADSAEGAAPRHPQRPAGVQFAAWAPAAVAPGGTLSIDLWAAVESQAEALAVQAGRVDHPPPAAAVAATEPSTIQLQLRIDGLLDGAPVQRLVWRGQPDHVRFTVPVAQRTPGGAHAARVRLSVGGLPLGELGFVLRVGADAGVSAPLEDTHAVLQRVHSAYAACSAADLERVQRCLDELRRVAPGLDVFTEAAALRRGDNWRERIERELLRRERLFLFWSAAAAESPWVDFEWRLALRRRGPQSIDAVLLDPPRRAPLPLELGDVASLELRLDQRDDTGQGSAQASP